MTLPKPVLDERKFQDIVDQAKKRIPTYFDGWTDHNVSDPGVTFIELFAWMTEMIIYRLNQTPDLLHVKLMELMGIQLQEPQPARAPITFWLSKSFDFPITIEAGTEVATTQTETTESIIFSTDRDLVIYPPQLVCIVTDASGRYVNMQSKSPAELADGLMLFTDEAPQPGEAVYFGFGNDLGHHLLQWQFDCRPNAGRGFARTPPYIWEAYSAGGWRVCEVESDETRGLNASGHIQLHLPVLELTEEKGQQLYWVRLRLLDERERAGIDGLSPYTRSPVLQGLAVASLGGTCPATHARVIKKEFLGRSDGSANQRFRLKTCPVLPRREGETLQVAPETAVSPHNDDDTPNDPHRNVPETLWTEVPDFGHSGPDDKHFTLNGVTGELRVGLAIRERIDNDRHVAHDRLRFFGAIPAKGAALYFTRYHAGGGEMGNVLATELNALKTSIPFVDKVMNRVRAEGGLDAETIDNARLRAPLSWQAQNRLVTEADFETLLSREFREELGRVKCLQARPSDASIVSGGNIHILVIPRLAAPDGYLTPEQLAISPEKRQALRTFLDRYRLLTTRLDIREPEYYRVAVDAVVDVSQTAVPQQVETAVQKRLYAFLNPLVGGYNGRGWPFGRDLYAGDVYAALQNLPGILSIRSVQMFLLDDKGSRRGPARERIELQPHGVVCSGRHRVEIRTLAQGV